MRIFFDIDGTLVDHESSEKAAVFAFYNNHVNIFRDLNREKFYSLWCDISNKHFARFLKREITFQKQRQERIIEVFKIVGVALKDGDADLVFKEYLQEYEQHWRLFDDVVPCLQHFTKGHSLGIISNGDLRQQLYKLTKMQVRNHFDLVVISGNVGVSKPDPKIFQIACEMGGVSPDQAYYIGDDLHTDIISCHHAGMKGIWLNRNRASSSEANIESIFSLEALRFCDFK